MKILNLSLDDSVLNKNSKFAKRAVEYGDLVEKYIVIAPFKEDKILELSDRATVYGVYAVNKIFSLFKVYSLAKKMIKEEKFFSRGGPASGWDVISVQDQYYLGFIALKLARKFKIGLEIQVHGFEKYFGLRKLIARYLLPRADAVRCVSQRLKKQLISEFRVKEEKIMVVPIFVERATHNAQRITRNDGKFVFLTVGRLVPVKNIVMQIKAIAQISKKSQIANLPAMLRLRKQAGRKSQTELWVVGDGPEQTRLEKLCYALRVMCYVKFFGWQNDLEKFYRQADVFLLTSNYEGWGLAVIEAASFGLPIIMTDVGCAGEVIRDGESGIVIPVGDEEKLGLALIKLIEDENLRQKLGESAQEAVRNLPSKEETLVLYKKSWEIAMKNN